jgi:hypothetical protein
VLLAAQHWVPLLAIQVQEQPSAQRLAALVAALTKALTLSPNTKTLTITA